MIGPLVRVLSKGAHHRLIGRRVGHAITFEGGESIGLSTVEWEYLAGGRDSFTDRDPRRGDMVVTLDGCPDHGVQPGQLARVLAVGTVVAGPGAGQPRLLLSASRAPNPRRLAWQAPVDRVTVLGGADDPDAASIMAELHEHDHELAQ